jgi:hypothetical protein
VPASPVAGSSACPGAVRETVGGCCGPAVGQIRAGQGGGLPDRWYGCWCVAGLELNLPGGLVDEHGQSADYGASGLLGGLGDRGGPGPVDDVQQRITNGWPLGCQDVSAAGRERGDDRVRCQVLSAEWNGRADRSSIRWLAVNVTKSSGPLCLLRAAPRAWFRSWPARRRSGEMPSSVLDIR